MLPGDQRRRTTKPIDADRSRAVHFLKEMAAEGKLSSRELDEKIELAWRARSLAELDAVTSGFSGTAHARSEVALAHELKAASVPRRQRSYLEKTLWYTGGWLVLWIVVWAVTGAGTVWLWLILVTSAVGLALRLARGERGRRRQRAGLSGRRRPHASSRDGQSTW